MEVSALSGLEGRARQECSGRGCQQTIVWWSPGHGAGRVAGLGGCKWSPPLWVQGGPCSTPALMTRFLAGRESTSEILCSQSPALCPRTAVTEQACSRGDHLSHEPHVKTVKHEKGRSGLWLVSPAFELATHPPRMCSEWLFCVARTSAAHIGA